MKSRVRIACFPVNGSAGANLIGLRHVGVDECQGRSAVKAVTNHASSTRFIRFFVCFFIY
jgi:hypothetical protein